MKSQCTFRLLAVFTIVPVAAAVVLRPLPAAAVVAGTVPSYTMVDLGKIGQRAEAVSINSRSEVVGNYSAGGWRGFLISPERTGGALVELPALACPECSETIATAVAINDRGEIAGTSSGVDGTHAVLWVAGAVRDLGRFGDDTAVVAMNNRGQVLGTGLGTDGTWHVWVWSARTGMRDISAGLWTARPYDINDRGQIVGQCGTSVGMLRACLWEPDGTLRIIPTEPGYDAVATAVNNRGVVVGSYGDAYRHSRAFRWERGMLTPVTGASDYSAIATDINDAGIVVGYWYLPSPTGPWAVRNGTVINLPATGSGPRQGPAMPKSINREGVIVGTSGTDDDVWFHAVLWREQRVGG